MPDPIKDIMTQGVAQIGTMNMQLATALAGVATQTATGLNTMATSMAASVPDLSAIGPAGMPGMPTMPGIAPARADLVAPPAIAPAYRPPTMRMIR